jgi:hypothetical protein
VRTPTVEGRNNRQEVTLRKWISTNRLPVNSSGPADLSSVTECDEDPTQH